MPADKTATVRARPGSRATPYPVDAMFVTLHRSAAGAAWRWRTELTLILGLAAALWRLAILLTLTAAAVVLVALALAVLAVPHSRRFTVRRFWCVLARHRIQRLCWEARLQTRAGRLPLVLWSRPTKVGERVHVLCRAGVCAEDFEDRTGEIRAACWARDARVTRNVRWSQLVTIDVIRRDTLAASRRVPSPLPRLHVPQDRPSWPAVPGLPSVPSLSGAGHDQDA
jgi:hypothetical protein